VLARFRDDLSAFLDAAELDGDELARRLFYAGPVHYRMTYVEEPPFPASYLPDAYPLGELLEFIPKMAERRAQALRRYLDRVSGVRTKR
jgi:hypothetical protein